MRDEPGERFGSGVGVVRGVKTRDATGGGSRLGPWLGSAAVLALVVIAGMMFWPAGGKKNRRRMAILQACNDHARESQ